MASVAAPDLTDVRGQERARRALELAAGGNHRILFAGPAGSYPIVLARCLPGLLPGEDVRVIDELAARCVWPQYDSSLVELRDGRPVAACAQLCPCGGRGDPDADCQCTHAQIAAYWAPIGTQLDWFDIVICLRPLLARERSSAPWESTAAVRERVDAIRRELADGPAPISVAAMDLIDRAECPPRAKGRALRVAQTAAAAAGKGCVLPEHVAEALSFRHPAALEHADRPDGGGGSVG